MLSAGPFRAVRQEFRRVHRSVAFRGDSPARCASGIPLKAQLRQTARWPAAFRFLSQHCDGCCGTVHRKTYNPICMPASASVTVSVVSHRQWALVKPLLEQLGRLCQSSVAKIVLTVNVPEEVEAVDPGIPLEVVRNAQPKGFGANHNAAFGRCTTPWFLVLNPDIRLDDDVIARLLAAAHPRTGLLAPRIQEPGKTQPEPFRDVLTPLELLRRRFPEHRPPAQPAWVPGMFMLVRREAFAALHGFDERFFMYCEDFDFCARMRLAGWCLQVVEDTAVHHDAQRASNRALRPLTWHLSSLAKLWTSSAFWRYLLLGPVRN